MRNIVFLLRKFRVLFEFVLIGILIYQLVQSSINQVTPGWQLAIFYVIVALGVAVIGYLHFQPRYFLNNEDEAIGVYKKIIRKLKSGDEIVFSGKAVTAVFSLVPHICQALKKGVAVKVFILDPGVAEKRAREYNQLEPYVFKEVIKPILDDRLDHKYHKGIIGPVTLNSIKELLNRCEENESEDDKDIPRLRYVIESVCMIWQNIHIYCQDQRSTSYKSLGVYGGEDSSSLYKLVRITRHYNDNEKISHYFVGINTNKGVGVKNPIMRLDIKGDVVDRGFADKLDEDINELSKPIDKCVKVKQLVPEQQ